MYGDNPVRPNEAHKSGSHLRVQDIFLTFQGEGPESGNRAVFIRLAGCNLRCSFCDTEFESNYENPLSLTHILKQVDSVVSETGPARKLVVLTGGEPLLQNIVPLIQLLLTTGTELVQIETAGTVWVYGLDELIRAGQVILVCSPKTPKVHPNVTQWCRHWKYVLKATELHIDGLPLMPHQQTTHIAITPNGFETGHVHKFVPTYRPWDGQHHGRNYGTIWVSPCDETGSAASNGQQRSFNNMNACVQSVMEHGYRLSLQTHKIVGMA